MAQHELTLLSLQISPTLPNHDNADHPGLHAQSHLSLCEPHDAVVDVKRISPGLTGLRREYLQALKANVEARREYQALTERVASCKNPPVETANSDPRLDLQAYLRLLRERRQYAKLQVFQHHLQQLKSRDIPSPEDFDPNTSRRQHLGLPEEFEEEKQNGHLAEEGIEELVHKLERAVIRAKAQVDKEKKLLEGLKAKQPPPEDISPAVRVAALQRTRNELVKWVEEKLVSVGSNEDGPMQEPPADEIEESARLLEEQKAQIMERYGAYVEARKRLLDAASRACQPIANGSKKLPERAPETVQVPAEEAPSLEPVDVLGYTTDILLPLSKAQRALAMQKFYLSGLLSKEKTTALRMLNRLRDESHLLPEYPILARQPRFKHAVAAINYRHSTNPTEPAKPDELVALAEAWAFASDAAGTNEREYVEQKVAEGSETVQDAQQLLRELYCIVNQDLDETRRGSYDAENEESDIWANEAQSTRLRGRTNWNDRRQPKGPWSRLSGKVGVVATDKVN
ncbi:uncharacterized protein ATNIH1004_003211 [Aspergillus tanneri]|uniref:Uncharacterized protein n=1 Tax=Aspergillus tanneri TaxID=1220188 RepID=A0A5M9MYU8_9EURO|nr:uncharacterized protein ATNIH1004_003211 [Aspergillus tanneri]KAA8650524.1 hypothetical protein ATNIH1004_003211 [Aspergillus tanneri]